MLSFKNLSVGYDKKVLEKISGEISEGQIIFLIGPNGSGKTTLLKTLSHILRPFEGIISTEDVPVYLTSDLQIQSGLTGNDLLDLYNAKNSKWFSEDLINTLEIKDLLNVPLENLSSGERQRMILLAVLSHPSNTVFLDEPLTHLDWNFSLKLKSILNIQMKKQRSFLISNHDLNWSLSFEQSQTWVLFKKAIFLKNTTESVLNDIKLQEVFKIKTEIIFNQNKKIISLSEL